VGKRAISLITNHMGVEGMTAVKVLDNTGDHVEYNKTFPKLNAWATVELATHTEGKYLSILMQEYGETSTQSMGSRKSRSMSMTLPEAEARAVYELLHRVFG
jgi:hypothetical protein